MANKLEDLVRVATVVTNWLVTLFIWSKRQRELQQQTPLKSLKLSFIWEPLFEVFETLFLFESLWSLWSSLFIREFFEVFETLLFWECLWSSLLFESHAQLSKGVTVATSQDKENFQQLVFCPPLKKQREFSTICLPCSPFKTKTSFKTCHGDHAKANGVGSSWKGRVIGLV